MKELVLKKRSELEEICRMTHIAPDVSTAAEKSNAMIDSGLVDPSELLTNIETHIAKAKEEAMSRKEIMERIDRWLSACEEENWLEDYNLDHNRYSAGRGVHINLKRAERARITVTKIPGIGWGWAGAIWLYSIVFYIPLDLFKFSIRYILSGKAWDNLLDNKTAFTTKKDYGKEEREAQWATAQRTLHGLQAPEAHPVFNDKNSYRELSEIAKQAKRRAEVAR